MLERTPSDSVLISKGGAPQTDADSARAGYGGAAAFIAMHGDPHPAIDYGEKPLSSAPVTTLS
jgi:hypothetical protein